MWLIKKVLMMCCSKGDNQGTISLGCVNPTTRMWRYPADSGISGPQYKDFFLGTGNPIITIIRSWDRLIYIKGIPILIKRLLYIVSNELANVLPPSGAMPPPGKPWLQNWSWWVFTSAAINDWSRRDTRVDTVNIRSALKRTDKNVQV